MPLYLALLLFFHFLLSFSFFLHPFHLILLWLFQLLSLILKLSTFSPIISNLLYRTFPNSLFIIPLSYHSLTTVLIRLFFISYPCVCPRISCHYNHSLSVSCFHHLSHHSPVSPVFPPSPLQCSPLTTHLCFPPSPLQCSPLTTHLCFPPPPLQCSPLTTHLCFPPPPLQCSHFNEEIKRVLNESMEVSEAKKKNDAEVIAEELKKAQDKSSSLFVIHAFALEYLAITTILCLCLVSITSLTTHLSHLCSHPHHFNVLPSPLTCVSHPHHFNILPSPLTCVSHPHHFNVLPSPLTCVSHPHHFNVLPSPLTCVSHPHHFNVLPSPLTCVSHPHPSGDALDADFGNSSHPRAIDLPNYEGQFRYTSKCWYLGRTDLP